MSLRQFTKMVLPALSRKGLGFPMTSPSRPYHSLNRSYSSARSRWHRSHRPAKFTRNNSEVYVAVVLLVGSGYFLITSLWDAMKIINEFDRHHEEREKKGKEKKEKEKEEKEKKLAVA